MLNLAGSKTRANNSFEERANAPSPNVKCRSGSTATEYLPPAPAVIAHFRRQGVRVRPKIAERHQRLAARVLIQHAGAGGIVATKVLVLGQLAVADHGRRLQAVLADPTAALNGAPA